MNLSWLKDVAKVSTLILPFIPGFPQQLTPFIAHGIETAELAATLPTDPDAKKAAKLAIAKDEVTNGITALNAVRPGTIDPVAVDEAVTKGIDTTIATLNAIHSVK